MKILSLVLMMMSFSAPFVASAKEVSTAKNLGASACDHPVIYEEAKQRLDVKNAIPQIGAPKTVRATGSSV